MENEKRKVGGYEVINSIHIADKELILAENMEYETNNYMTCEVTNDGLRENYDNAMLSDNFIEIAELYAQRIQGQVQKLKEHYATLPDDKTPIGVNSCIPLNECKDITNCVMVLDPSYFRAEYRTPTAQVYIAKSGNGVREHSFGTAVYCNNLYTGERTRLERYEFYGILKPECYPDWVKSKVQMLDIIKNNPNVFEYAGYHFVPVGNVTGKDFEKHIASDMIMGIWSNKYIDTYGNGKINYSHADFYKACNNSKCDVFMCLENNKKYIPAENELFEYTGEYKEIETQQKSNAQTKSKKNKEMER